MSCTLAAIDLGPTSTHVIDQAINLARAYEAKIIVVHANATPRGERTMHAVSTDRDEGMARDLNTDNAMLDRLVARVRQAGLLKTVVHDRADPEDLICDAIGHYEPSYTVLGAMKPSTKPDSVPAEIMRRTHIPVVFVQEPQPID